MPLAILVGSDEALEDVVVVTVGPLTQYAKPRSILVPVAVSLLAYALSVDVDSHWLLL